MKFVSEMWHPNGEGACEVVCLNVCRYLYDLIHLCTYVCAFGVVVFLSVSF